MRKLRIKPIRITTRGKLYIMLTISVGLAAVNTANNILFLLLGFFLSLIIISGIMSEINLFSLVIRHRFPSAIWADTSFYLRLEMKNKKSFFPSYAIESEDLFKNFKADKRCYFLKIAPGIEQTAKYKLKIPYRGEFFIDGFLLLTRYPFGLFEKRKKIVQDNKLVVFPRIKSELLDEAKLPGDEGEENFNFFGQSEEIASVREYNVNDDNKLIHWNTSARKGKLMVKQMDKREGKSLAIYIDHTTIDKDLFYNPPKMFDPLIEEAISLATTIAYQALNRDWEVTVVGRGVMSSKVNSLANKNSLFQFLSLLKYNKPDFVDNFKQIDAQYSILILPRSNVTNININVDNIFIIDSMNKNYEI